jgi:malonyl-CoA/methylmalonyl-CoA synthetase
MSDNLYLLFQDRFPEDANAVFLEHDRRNVLFAELDDLSAKYAAVLKQNGVVPGDRVLVQADKSPESVVLYLACLRVGSVFLPINTGYTASEVDFLVGDSRPTLIVCRPRAFEELITIAGKHKIDGLLTLGSDGTGTLIEQAADIRSDNTVVERGADDIAAILYTSGTTGKPKGAMLSHGNLASNALVIHDYWGWVPGDVLLHALPIFHVHGLFVALHCALLNGSKTIFLDAYDVERVLAELPRSTVMMGVPTFYTRLLEEPRFGRAQCANMRLFLAGSAPLLSETFDEFEQRTGHAILERYGMTEAGMITSNPYDGARLAGTVGYALPGVEARIADAEGSAMPAGEPGVLEIRGPNLFKGYWGLPEKTAEEFRDDGFFITGDVATMSEDGRIAIVGRAKDLVITGGYNVYPKEIEAEIDALPGVRESAVIGVPHPDFGEGVTAIVVLDNSAPVTADTIKEFLGGKVAKFKQPKSVIFADELPRNTMGKVQKQILRSDYADLYTSPKTEKSDSG